jgi:hypothetical protein
MEQTFWVLVGIMFTAGDPPTVTTKILNEPPLGYFMSQSECERAPAYVRALVDGHTITVSQLKLEMLPADFTAKLACMPLAPTVVPPPPPPPPLCFADANYDGVVTPGEFAECTAICATDECRQCCTNAYEGTGN